MWQNIFLKTGHTIFFLQCAVNIPPRKYWGSLSSAFQNGNSVTGSLWEEWGNGTTCHPGRQRKILFLSALFLKLNHNGCVEVRRSAPELTTWEGNAHGPGVSVLLLVPLRF